MARIWSTELAAQAGQPVELAGWLHRFRQLSRVSFLILRDGRGLERWVARLVDAPNIRETTLFPRDINRLTP